MSGRWWRAYDEAVDDPKLQMLPPPLFKAWFNLLCLASSNDGALPKLPAIAFKLRISEERARHAVAELTACGLFDDVDGRFIPHNWASRQFKSDVSTERVSKFRKRKGNVSPAVTETPPETDTEEQITETDSERTSLRSENAREQTDDWPKDFSEQFWNKYPNKVGRPRALAKLDAARKRGVAWNDLWGGLCRYVAKTDDRPWCNPETWINQERWTDQPAATNGNRNGHNTKSLSAAADDAIARAEGAERTLDLGPEDWSYRRN